jgi:hypothetical protein
MSSPGMISLIGVESIPLDILLFFSGAFGGVAIGTLGWYTKLCWGLVCAGGGGFDDGGFAGNKGVIPPSDSFRFIVLIPSINNYQVFIK